MNYKDHWEHVYKTKSPNEVSWTQEIPRTSLGFIHGFHLPVSAKIIDIGGGDSRLVDYLLKEGFTNITVLDISESALEKAKKRLGKDAKKVKWIVSDITSFQPDDKYDLWHDRATFHFLTTEDKIERYLSIAKECTTKFITIGTFSDNGPEKCSGLNIRQYTEKELTQTVSNGFEKLECRREEHVTPFKTKQEFLFCSFQKKHN